MIKGLNTGDKAPEFSLIGADGMIHTLVDYKGFKGVCFCFLARGCKTSKETFSKINKLQEKYKSIAFVGVFAKDAAESFTSTLEELKALPLEVDILLDSTKDLSNKFSIETTPHFFVFNQSKHLIYSGAFEDQNTKEEYLANALYELIGGLPISTPTTNVYGSEHNLAYT